MDAAAWIAGLVGLTLGVVGTRILVTRAPATREAVSLLPPRARQVLGALPYALVVCNEGGQVVFANPRALGIGLKTTTGVLLDSAREVVSRAFSSGQSTDGVISLHLSARESAPFFLVASPAHGTDVVVLSAHDLGSAEAAQVARREFIVNVSHELKTPIGALALLSEAIHEAADDPGQVRVFAGQMSEEAQRLADLVQQIIYLSRVQGAEEVADPRLVAVPGLVADAVKAVRARATSNNVQVEVAPVPDVTLSGDPEMLAMAVRNLVENAVIYSPTNGKVVLAVREEGDVVVFSFVDTGIGISPEDQQRVFERFYRADEARARETGGTGLGLSIVKHVAHQHGGSVDLWSTRGVGSTFTLRIPRAEASQG